MPTLHLAFSHQRTETRGYKINLFCVLTYFILFHTRSYTGGVSLCLFWTLTTVWAAVVLLLWWRWSKEKSAPAWQLCTSHQSVSRAVNSYWQIWFLALCLPLLRSVFYPSPSAFQRIPLCLWLLVCLCVCVCVTADISCASSLHSPSSVQSLFLCSHCLFLFPHQRLTFSFPLPPILPPLSICCMFTCPQSNALVWLWVSLRAHPPPQQQTLFTLLLNKPKGENDPRWHALASSQHILNKPRRKRSKKKERGTKKSRFVSPGHVSISAEKIWEWRQWLKRSSN